MNFIENNGTDLSFVVHYDADNNESFVHNVTKVPRLSEEYTQDYVTELPLEFTTVEKAEWPKIYAYLAVFLCASIGNICVLVSVCLRMKVRASPMNRLLLHLCIADLVVVFMVAAVEFTWRIAIGWYAGNIACKLIQFLRAFGLYLSSLVLICISLDRYYAVVHPLKVVDAAHRVKIMLISAWITATLCALPQTIVFRVESHPQYPAFRQCASFWLGEVADTANTALSLSVMYFIPLGVIIFSYTNIILKVSRESDEPGRTSAFLRRNGPSVIGRAKIRTLKLTFVIVIVFFVCWTPYVIITSWHMIDRASAENINGYVQDALFIMAVANSCANPLVYGIFSGRGNKRNRRRSPSSKDDRANADSIMLQRYPSTYRNNQNGMVTPARTYSAKYTHFTQLE